MDSKGPNQKRPVFILEDRNTMPLSERVLASLGKLGKGWFRERKRVQGISAAAMHPLRRYHFGNFCPLLQVLGQSVRPVRRRHPKRSKWARHQARMRRQEYVRECVAKNIPYN